MKLFVIFAAVACCNAAKLDKTYLPPSHSQSSGGSSNFLQAPFAGSAERLGQGNGFGRSGNGFGENRNSFAQNGNDFAPSGNSFIQNDNNFAQNGNGFAQNGNNQANDNEYTQNADNGFGNFENRPERPQAAFERNAAILRQDNQNDGETYAYAYETENGIFAEENGVATNGVEAQGGYSYTGDDGQVYSIRYTADQNGFVPQGDHLPTPPPIPEEILKALEQNARDEAAGIYDDGSYNEGKYSNGDDQYNNNANSINNGNAYNNQNQYNDDDDSVVTDNAFYRNSGADRFNNGADEDFNGANQGGFRNAAAGQSVNKAYLPPFAAQRSSNGPNFGSRSRQPSFSARNGYRY